MRSNGRPTRKDECLERLKCIIVSINPSLELCNVLFPDARNIVRRRRVERSCEISAKGEQHR
jgi:hypothetical protein